MSEFFAFFGEHYFLAWCALWLLWMILPLTQMVLSWFVRTYRVVMVCVRGWPPEHLDADGDWKK